MNATGKERKLIDVETMAGFMRKHPETIRRQARSGALPAIKVDGEWKFDYWGIVDFFIRQDTLQSLDRITSDAKAPREIRRNAEEMANGLRDGWLSIDDIGNIIAQVS
jgi:hypothetical protein